MEVASATTTMRWPSVIHGIIHSQGIRLGRLERRRKVERGLSIKKYHQNQYQYKYQYQYQYQVRCKAVDERQSSSSSSNTNTDGVTYQGIYGPWTIDPSDIREVVLYRSGLVVAALSFVVAASTPFLPNHSFFRDFLDNSLDFFFLSGATGLALSLYLIHIYVTFIKRTLQALWLFGAISSLTTYLSLAQPAGQGLVHYVVHNPIGVLFVGPIFASLTGLVFKEGLCYGKLEAALLAIVIPACLLGHLSGAMDDGVKMSLLGIWVALFSIFAARKFTQPVKDDIGDKSVFIFNDLPEEEKRAVVEKLSGKM